MEAFLGTTGFIPAKIRDDMGRLSLARLRLVSSPMFISRPPCHRTSLRSGSMFDEQDNRPNSSELDTQETVSRCLRANHLTLHQE
jgi:hypothetical protein